MAEELPEIRHEAVEEALSDESSREVLAACIGEARAAKEINELKGIPLATVYRRIDELEDAGLLLRERDDEPSASDRSTLYRSRIEQMTLSVTASGVDVTWSVDEPVEDRLLRMWDHLRAEP